MFNKSHFGPGADVLAPFADLNGNVPELTDHSGSFRWADDLSPADWGSFVMAAEAAAHGPARDAWLDGLVGPGSRSTGTELRLRDGSIQCAKGRHGKCPQRWLTTANAGTGPKGRFLARAVCVCRCGHEGAGNATGEVEESTGAGHCQACRMNPDCQGSFMTEYCNECDRWYCAKSSHSRRCRG